VAAGHHQNERVIAQANPTQAALVHRWAALERDAGRLALVAEHHREVELAGDDPWEQLVRLSLDDLDIDAERSACGSTRLGLELLEAKPYPTGNVIFRYERRS
jgi:hypothetical protein